MNSPSDILGDFVGEFAKGFRHIAAIAASSSLSTIFGIVAKLTLSADTALIFSNLFFSIAALPLAALVIRQAIHIIRVSDPHEELKAPAPSQARMPHPTTKAVQPARRQADAKLSRPRRARGSRTTQDKETSAELPPPTEAPMDAIRGWLEKEAVTQRDPGA
jgi:hypothetical protein